MTSALQKQDDGTLQITVTIPWEEVKKTETSVVDEFVKHAELKGFRKGKAPKKLVEESLDRAKVKEEVLKQLLPNAYVEALKKHNLNPIVNPKIHVEKLDDDKDWQFIALTCEMPKVELGKYKDEVQKITAKSKIIVPGKEPQVPKFDEIVDTLLKNVTVTIPHILIDNEVEKLLAQTLDDIKKLGLTLDQYLASTGKTPESLRNDYAKRAQNDITFEFALTKIAEEEKITVEEKEVEEAILKAKDDAERKNLEQNHYLLTAILRQQKTLDFLKNL